MLDSRVTLALPKMGFGKPVEIKQSMYSKDDTDALQWSTTFRGHDIVIVLAAGSEYFTVAVDHHMDMMRLSEIRDYVLDRVR